MTAPFEAVSEADLAMIEALAAEAREEYERSCRCGCGRRFIPYPEAPYQEYATPACRTRAWRRRRAGQQGQDGGDLRGSG